MTDTINNLETTSTDNVETTVETTNDPAKFSFESIEQGLALYMDAMRGREAIEKELEDAIKHSSDVCESILKQYGAGPFNLGDGHPRGHIVVKRGDLYFIRARNTGRPAGSKNKASKADGEKTAAAASSAEQAVAQVSQAAEAAVAEAEAPAPVVEETAAVDVVQLAKTAEALVSATSQLAEALKAHSSSQQHSSAAE